MLTYDFLVSKCMFKTFIFPVKIEIYIYIYKYILIRHVHLTVVFLLPCFSQFCWQVSNKSMAIFPTVAILCTIKNWFLSVSQQLRHVNGSFRPVHGSFSDSVNLSFQPKTVFAVSQHSAWLGYTMHVAACMHALYNFRQIHGSFSDGGISLRPKIGFSVPHSGSGS